MKKETIEHAANLAKIYEKGTAKELWEAWTPANRIHFLIDHSTEFFELMGDDFNKSSGSYSILSYDTLPSPIRKSVIIHHAQGMYKQGGPIETSSKTANDFKLGTPAVYHSFDYKGDRIEESGEIVMNKEEYHDKKENLIYKPKTIKGISLYPDKEYSGSGDRFIVPHWHNIESYDEATTRQEKGKKFVIKMNEGGSISKKLSPAKKKLQDRIHTLTQVVASAGEAAQKSIRKKIEVLQKQFDYNPSAKERAQANKGKFAMDVPVKYSKSIYKKLWNMDIKPQVLELKGIASIVVNSQLNLQKAYQIYSSLLKEKGEKVPALSKISRKL